LRGGQGIHFGSPLDRFHRCSPVCV
jgi:hypothetical protein